MKICNILIFYSLFLGWSPTFLYHRTRSICIPMKWEHIFHLRKPTEWINHPLECLFRQVFSIGALVMEKILKIIPFFQCLSVLEVTITFSSITYLTWYRRSYWNKVSSPIFSLLELATRSSCTKKYFCTVRMAVPGVYFKPYLEWGIRLLWIVLSHLLANNSYISINHHVWALSWNVSL